MKNAVFALLFFMNSNLFADNAILVKPQIRMNASGNAVLEWAQYNGINFAIYESTLAKGDSWANPIRVSPLNHESIYHQLSINDADEVFFIWQTYNGRFFEIEVATADFGNAPTAPATLSSHPSFFPIITVDMHGNAVAAWQEMNSTEKYFSTSNYVLGSWTSPIRINGGGNYFVVPVVANQPGSLNAIALWHKRVEKDILGVSAAYFDGNTWSGLTLLSPPDRDAVSPQIAFSSTGEAIAVWQTSQDDKLAIQIASNINGLWHPTRTISNIDYNLLDPRPAINASGQAVIVGRRFDGIQSHIIAIVRNEGIFEEYTVVSTETNCESPEIALNDSGQAIVVWSTKRSEKHVVQAATLEIGQVWSEPVDISINDGLNPQVVIDNTGYGIVSWKAPGSFIETSILPIFGGPWDAPEVVNPNALF